MVVATYLLVALGVWLETEDKPHPFIWRFIAAMSWPVMLGMWLAGLPAPRE